MFRIMYKIFISMMVKSSGTTLGTPNIRVGEREVTHHFSRNPKEKGYLERPGWKYENNNKINLKKICVECRQLVSIISLNRFGIFIILNMRM